GAALHQGRGDLATRSQSTAPTAGRAVRPQRRQRRGEEVVTSMPQPQPRRDQPAEPTVDILLTVYNGMPYLNEQIRSLQAQTHASWRLWVRDDGSTDG